MLITTNAFKTNLGFSKYYLCFEKKADKLRHTL